MVLARDPGPVDPIRAQEVEDAQFAPPVEEDDDDDEGEEEEEGEMSLSEALMKESASREVPLPWRGNGEKRWCKKVRIQKPPIE